MSKEIENVVKATIDEHMPVTPDELARRLKLWIEVGQEDNAKKFIVKEDGSMVDDLFALLQLIYVFFVLTDAYAKSTTELLLHKARAHLIRSVLAEFEKMAK